MGKKNNKEGMSLKYKEINRKLGKEQEYEKAKEIVEEAKKDKEITPEQAANIEYQLFSLASKQRNYKEVHRIAGNLINNENFNEDLKNALRILMIKELKRKDIKDAKAFAYDIIDDKKVAIHHKIAVLKKLEQILIENRNYDEANDIEEKIKTLQNMNEESNDKEDENESDFKEHEKANKIMEKSKIDSKRKKLYNGKFTSDDINSIDKKYCSTIRGCIFLAELYKYFNLTEKGEQCLIIDENRFQEISKDEKRAISQAREILKNNKFIPNDRKKEQWDRVYKTLDRNVVSTDDEGR